MPVFEYECRRCRRETTVLLLGTDQPPLQCEGCGSTELRRLCSLVNVSSARAPSPSTTLSDPNGFVSAMRGLEQSHGMSLTKNEMDRAVSRLEAAKADK